MKEDGQVDHVGEEASNLVPNDEQPVLSVVDPQVRRLRRQFDAALAPSLELIRAQSRSIEDALRGFSDLNRIVQQFNVVTIPELTAARRLHDMMSRQARITDRYFRGVDQMLAPIQALAAQQRAITQQQLAAFRRFAEVAVPELSQRSQLFRLDEWLPENWEDVRSARFVRSAVDVLIKDGIPLAWIPRQALVVRLVEAPDQAARDAILASTSEDIADDCLAALAEITDPELEELADLALAAATALKEGHGASAQALAGNVLDTLVRTAARRGVIFTGPPIGYFKYDKVRMMIPPVAEDIPIRQFRSACVLTPLLLALDHYDPDLPPPARFVRHATAHRASRVQYTPANAVVAVMLMTSLLREAEAVDW